jgi:hypothetical protein
MGTGEGLPFLEVLRAEGGTPFRGVPAEQPEGGSRGQGRIAGPHGVGQSALSPTCLGEPFFFILSLLSNLDKKLNSKAGSLMLLGKE